MKKKIIATSKEAYHSLDPEKITQIKKDIVMALRLHGPMHYEDIAAVLKKEPERIWRRMSDCHRDGLVERTGERKKMRSGREGFIWKDTGKLPSTEKALEGKSIADFSRALIQPSPSSYIQEKLF